MGRERSSYGLPTEDNVMVLGQLHADLKLFFPGTIGHFTELASAVNQTVFAAIQAILY